MVSVPASLLRALGQMGDPRILRVIGKSLAVTLAIFLALAAALFLGLRALFESWGWSESGVTGASIAALLAIAGLWLLFRLVALAVLQFFADDIVRAVEDRHYPDAALARRDIPLNEEVRNSARALLRAIGVNLLALPFALVLLVTGVGTVLLFFAVNAWLLGRELQDMEWLRQAPPGSDAAPLGMGERLLLGAAVAGLLLVPFANLLAPVLGAASATHLVHRRKDALQ